MASGMAIAMAIADKLALVTLSVEHTVHTVATNRPPAGIDPRDAPQR